MEIAFTFAPPPPFSGVFIVPPFLFWFVFNLLASKMHDTSSFLVICDTCIYCAWFCWYVVFWHGNSPSMCFSENENAPENYTIKLLPMSETFDFDRGLLLAVQAIQVGMLKTRLLLLAQFVIVIITSFNNIDDIINGHLYNCANIEILNIFYSHRCFLCRHF